jgi:tetratricopeptide (TPR) repeat protein
MRKTPLRTNCGEAAKQRKGDLDGAMADYNQAIRLDPKNVQAYNNRGTVKFKEGDLKGAMAHFNRSIQLNPKNPHAYNNRVRAKEMKGDLDGAIADFNEAIRLNPKYAHAYNNRGTTKERREITIGLYSWMRSMPPPTKTGVMPGERKATLTEPMRISIRPSSSVQNLSR